MGKQLFDQYTLLHFASGIVVYFWGINFTNWIILHTLFEMFENTNLGMNIINKYIGIWPGGKPHIDSNVNILGDSFGALLGWMLAYYVDQLGERKGWYKSHLPSKT